MALQGNMIFLFNVIRSKTIIDGLASTIRDTLIRMHLSGLLCLLDSSSRQRVVNWWEIRCSMTLDGRGVHRRLSRLLWRSDQ
jgi:hypothetical protein